MKLIDVIEQLTAIEKQAYKHISFADVEKVTIEFKENINLIIKPKEIK